MTCPVRDGGDAFIKEGQCAWTQVSGRSFDQDQTFQTLGFDETASGRFQGERKSRLARYGGLASLCFRLRVWSRLNTSDTNAKADSDRLNGGWRSSTILGRCC